MPGRRKHFLVDRGNCWLRGSPTACKGMCFGDVPANAGTEARSPTKLECLLYNANDPPPLYGSMPVKRPWFPWPSLFLQLATPILSMLDGSANAWLGSMMQAFHMGDIDAFNKLCSENQEVRFFGTWHENSTGVAAVRVGAVLRHLRTRCCCRYVRRVVRVRGLRARLNRECCCQLLGFSEERSYPSDRA